MTKAERIQRAVERKPVDRTPVSFWRHFPELDDDPFALAETLLAFHARYDLDFIKVMPTGVYCVEDWGCRVGYQGDIDGSRVCVDHAVKRPGDWAKLRLLDPEAGVAYPNLPPAIVRRLQPSGPKSMVAAPAARVCC